MRRFLCPARGIAGALLLWALAGCATPGLDRLSADPGDLPPRAEVAAVPFFPQQRFYCGPAALATVLAWSGLVVTQDDLVGQVYTPAKQGTFRSDILAAARRHGRLAARVEDLPDLLGEIAAGHPVLVFQNLGLDWIPKWHFAVAVGYDLEARNIVLRSGEMARRITPLATFERTWARGDSWALVVLPPDQLPRHASKTAVLRAASALERAKRPGDAATAYSTLLRRWPRSYGAMMGLGNARFAQDDLEAAEAAFRRAIAERPKMPQAWNNLAHVLANRGDAATAGQAAREAVRLAGAKAGLYRATLREISSVPLPPEGSK